MGDIPTRIGELNYVSAPAGELRLQSFGGSNSSGTTGQISLHRRFFTMTPSAMPQGSASSPQFNDRSQNRSGKTSGPSQDSPNDQHYAIPQQEWNEAVQLLKNTSKINRNVEISPRNGRELRDSVNPVVSKADRTSGTLPAKTVVQEDQKRDTRRSTPTPDRQRKRVVAEEPQKPKASDARKVQQLGDFQLKKKLGKGGMGEVFLARQISLDRLVALKTLSKELARKSDFVARFEREAKSMAKIDHPNVVKIYAVDSFKGIHFAAIEYIDGQSVQNWLDHLGRFSIADSLYIAIICAEALKHAHAENMVHRDIKPDNILITKKGVVKVADFGLAKAMDEDVSMTQSGTGLGTPLYMAPEQARNAKHVDHRVDIYALGATLYHLLTGTLPFTGTTALELIMAKEKGMYSTARSIRNEIPERLDLIIDKMMAKDPNHRYKSCDEAIRDLMALGAHGDTLSFIEGAEPVGPGRGGPSTLGAVGGTQSIRRPVAVTQNLAGDTASAATRIWYIQYEDAKGKTVVEKHSTGRILKMLAGGQLTAKTRAKFSADGSYVPLAQFPEFAKAVEDSLARKSVSIRKEDMQSLYKKVEKEQKTFYLKRRIKDAFRSLVGMTSLLLLLAGVGVVIYLGVQYFPAIPAWVAEQIGLNKEPEVVAPAETSGDPNSSAPSTPMTGSLH